MSLLPSMSVDAGTAPPMGERTRTRLRAWDRQSGINWLVVLAAYIVTAGAGITRALMSAKTVPLLNDPDDAMRLTTVRDLLGGQNWFDHLEHRLNTPYGAEIHWSHLIDAAIGGIIVAARPAFGAMSDTVAVYVWPLLLLALLLVLLAKLADRLAGPEAVLPAVVMPMLSPGVISEFSPGRIDHHSIQILLTLLMVWSVIESRDKWHFAVVAGVAAALALTVGIEGLPAVLCALLAMSLMWAADAAHGPALRWFGVSFAGATVAMLAVAYPPSQWLVPACDELSIVYVDFAIGVGVVLTALSVLPLGGRPGWQRLVLGAALGGALAALLAGLFPVCLGGPYAEMDPWLVKNWLNDIVEAEPLTRSLAGSPAFTIGATVPPLLALAVIGFRLLAGEHRDRWAWAVLGLFLVAADAVMWEQVRGARIAGALAAPAAAWLIVWGRQRYLAGRRLAGGSALIGGWMGFAGLLLAVITAIAVPHSASANTMPQQACRLPAAFEPLAKLPPARVMSLIDLGSHTLMFTKDSVVGAPYQRDQQGLRDAINFFNGPISAGRQILAARGVTLVVTCASLPESRGLPWAAPDSFDKLFAANKLPSWLQEISTPGASLKIYRVLPQ